MTAYAEENLEMKTCLYCGEEKNRNEFSDEHIWPNALGGDFLSKDMWRTDKVCQRCNNTCGLFVDGEFIRSWFGQAERSSGSLEYLAGKKDAAAIPLNYLGPIKSVPVPHGQVADYWAGPCGANIVHIRPDDGNENWTTYSGGNPIVKKNNAGRAYIALTSSDEFWIRVSLESFLQHFDRAERFIVNASIPSDWGIKVPDRQNDIQAQDLRIVDAVTEVGKQGGSLHLQPAVSVDVGKRMLAKLGLAVGYQLLGKAFLDTDSAKSLRSAMREGDFQKRRSIPLRGSGFIKGTGGGGDIESVLNWPGGWVLMILPFENKLGLCLISPSGRSMMILISEDAALLANLDPKYSDGVIWITVPAAKKAVGPISLPAYLAHRIENVSLAALTELESLRGDPANLPKCR
ncbi:HNH endonuclease [Agrobacterium sp. NPDC090283]|uniref:HNH endonuclease n=1 Tax=Agrobacterium sp. NPDC090283 TaxID=3363920 RepID=UPI00383AA754